MSKSSMIVASHERTKAQLQRLQGLPLIQKEALTMRRIEQFYTELNRKVYVSFSGGKDSTVLLHMARRLYPEIQGVFINTGVEYPGINEFVQKQENITWLKPKMAFPKVLKEYGYPMPSKENAQKIYEIQRTKSPKLLNKRLNGQLNAKGQKNGKLPEKWKYLLDEDIKISHKCCDILKKNPAKAFEKGTGLAPITGEMAAESRMRETDWLRRGCNAFDGKRVKSKPMAFWKEEDVWSYIKKHGLEIAQPYHDGETRTGCMYCLFGCQFDDADGWRRFDRIKEHYPKHYKAAENMGIIDALEILKRCGK